jgi:hypothetical protein
MKSLIALAAFATIAAATPAFAVTADFEDGIVGTAITLSGATVDNGFYNRCAGGCPTPENGLFASSRDFSSTMRITFASLQSLVSFVNVSNSQVTANAYDSGGTLLASINDTQAFPIDNAALTLSAANISYVEFLSAAAFGIDNLTYDASAAVPEPSSWGMMLVGFGLIGAAARRRRTLVAA